AGAWIETFARSGLSTTLIVAPHAGAWVETDRNAIGQHHAPWSRPTRARGLKHYRRSARPPIRRVAPHAGAWIETSRSLTGMTLPTVAPHAGAWIETSMSTRPMFSTSVSRPTRARGLKLF